jgi:hypothetical protein
MDPDDLSHHPFGAFSSITVAHAADAPQKAIRAITAKKYLFIVRVLSCLMEMRLEDAAL